MAKKDRPISVLIIDDKPDYCDALAGSARAEQILLKSATNLEDGIQLLKDDKKIEFVILDGKCFVDGDQLVSGSTSNNIPHRAKVLVDEMNRDQNREIGYCVNTGFVDDLQESFEGIFTVFDKDKSSKELFNYIKQTTSASETRKLKRIYKEAFEVFDLGIVDAKYEHLLIDVLTSLEKSDYRKKNIGPMRDLLEAVYHGLIGTTCIPSTFLNVNGNPNLEWCTRYMEQKSTDDAAGNSFTLSKPVPQEMKSAFRKLKEATSGYTHLNDSDIIKYPFLSNAYIMLEVLTWLPVFHSQYYK